MAQILNAVDTLLGHQGKSPIILTLVSLFNKALPSSLHVLHRT
jgi:hypothetical protein